MIFKLNRIELLKGLQNIGSIVNTNASTPILNGIHFKLSEDKLCAMALGYDATTTAIVTINAMCELNDNGKEVVIPAKLLMDTVKCIDDEFVTIIVNETTFSTQIVSYSGKYTIAGMKPELFPKLPSIDDAINIKIPISTLIKAIKTTIFATSNDNMRPNMCGVLFDFNNEGAKFVATDAHILSKYTNKDISIDDKDVSFIIPKSPIATVVNILNTLNGEGDVEISYNTTNISFTKDNYNIVCRLVDGKFPNYSAIIPGKGHHMIYIGRGVLIDAIKRIRLFANKSTSLIRFSVDSNILEISAEDVEFSNQAYEKLECQYDGEPIQVGYNAGLMLEILSNLAVDNIIIDFENPRSPTLVYSQNVDDNEDFLMLIMPMMLQN